MKTSRRTRTLNGYTIIKSESGDYHIYKDEKAMGVYTSLSAARFNILHWTTKGENK